MQVLSRGRRKPSLVLAILLSACTFCEHLAAVTYPVAVFRYDDFGAKSPLVIENEIVRIFSAAGVRCTFGVIPFEVAGDYRVPHQDDLIPLPAPKADLLRQGVRLGAIEVALHGFSHGTVARQKWGSDRFTEFGGVTFREQVQKVSRGKSFVEEMLNRNLRVFIPPWNSYDSNTVAAIEELGLPCISADVLSYPGRSKKIKFLPTTCELLGFERAIETAKSVRQWEPIIVCLFHPYDFLESGDARARISCAQFEALVNGVCGQKDVSVLSLGQVLDLGVDLSDARLRANRFMYRWAPPLLRPAQGAYLLSKGCLRASLMTLLFYVSSFTVGLAVSLGISARLSKSHRLPARFAMYSTGCGLLLFLTYALRAFYLTWRAAAISVFLLGAFLATIVSWQLRWRTHNDGEVNQACSLTRGVGGATGLSSAAGAVGKERSDEERK